MEHARRRSPPRRIPSQSRAPAPRSASLRPAPDALLSYNGTTWAPTTAPADDHGGRGDVHVVTSCTAVDHHRHASSCSTARPGPPTSLVRADPSARYPGPSRARPRILRSRASPELSRPGTGPAGPVKSVETRDFNSVSCASATSCVAVDTRGRRDNLERIDVGLAPHRGPLRLRTSRIGVLPVHHCPARRSTRAGTRSAFNGSTWSAPVLALRIGGRLVGVSCPDNLFCAAVDNQGGILTWNGATWSHADHRRPEAPLLVDLVHVLDLLHRVRRGRERVQVQRLDVVGTDCGPRSTPVGVPVLRLLDVLRRGPATGKHADGVRRHELEGRCRAGSPVTRSIGRVVRLALVVHGDGPVRI